MNGTINGDLSKNIENQIAQIAATSSAATDQILAA
jgi:hypothetical protein